MEWYILPRPGGGGGGVPVTWAEACGQARSHLQGTHSVSCLKAWASSPTADSLDTTVLPILTPFTTCLLLYPHFRDAQLPAISGLGSPGKGEQRELWEAPSLGGSWRCPSTFIFRTRHRSRPTWNPSSLGQRQTWVFVQEPHLLCPSLFSVTPRLP